MQKETAYIGVYNRIPIKGEYPCALAYSVHLSYSDDGLKFKLLHKNYGIVFTKGELSEENTIIPKAVKNPQVFRTSDGKYGICGERINENGTSDITACGKILLWKTEDFINFSEEELVEKSFLSELKPADFIEVDKEVVDNAVKYWNPITNTELILPDGEEVSSEEELNELTVTAVYSDGSRVEKVVDWNAEDIDFQKEGSYHVKGKVKSAHYPYPLANGYGDPVLLKWEGKWYFIATNDNLDDIGIYIREADTIEGLFEDGIKEHLILPFDIERGFVQTFWAPEFHVIGGELYILFAVSGEQWGPQCHMMKLKKGKALTAEESWENPIKAVRKDGSPLTEDGITLDMTYINAASGSYVIWSYRKDIGTTKDTGSMLYIATIDEREPWRLTSEPILLSRPLYGWENVEGTINNEGPYGFIQDGKVYLTYSGGSANSYTYALGLLTADEEDDLLEVSNWKKSVCPVLTYYSVSGEYGPGHNSFFLNDENELMIAYHAETKIDDHLRCDGIRRVHFRNDGRPDFELSAQQDLKEEYRNVEVMISVRKN